MATVRLRRAGTGVYRYDAGSNEYDIENPHLISRSDPTHRWFVHAAGPRFAHYPSGPPHVYGPFDTLRDVREWIAEHEGD